MLEILDEVMLSDETDLKVVTGEWIANFKKWRTFNTLTFRDPREPDVALRYFRRLIQVLNTDAFGKNYVKKVGHCYFSYVLAMEYQKRDCVHFHFLADKPINFSLLHDWWGAAAGFAWCKKIENVPAVSMYVAKYCLKSGSGVTVFENKTLEYTPLVKGPQGCFLPYWWKTS